MARFIPLSTLAQGGGPSAAGSDIDWTAILSKLFKPAGTAANLAGFSDVGSGISGLGGLFNLGTGIASGNPMQAATGAVSAGNTASGLLGGPTIGSAVTSVAPQLSAFVPGAAASAALAPFAMMAMGGINAAMTGGGDLFDTWFGGFKPQALKQLEEHRGYLHAFPGLVGRRKAGADLFDDMGEIQTPEQIEQALRTAFSGTTATDLSPAYSHLKQAPHEGKSPFAADIPGMDMSWWEEIAPGLEGENWASYIGLLDKGSAAGLDLDAITGDRERQRDLGAGGGLFTDPLTGLNTDRPSTSTPGWASQNAYDVSNAVAGIGGELGIDWGSRGDERAGVNQGYTLQDDQLGEYGFQEGQQGPALLNYLRNLDASVLEDEDFDRYATALGTTRDAVLAMPTFTPTLRNRPQNPLLMDLSGWGSTA